jgi:hypothetical protein
MQSTEQQIHRLSDGRFHRSVPIQARIRASVHIANDCWLWGQSVSRAGYGQITVDRSRKLAHRTSYEAFVGPIPDGMTVWQSCGWRSCVNPEHLLLGTRSEASARREKPSTEASRASALRRFSTRYAVSPGGCWEWRGAITTDGYATLSIAGRTVYAHRFSYESLVGSIPDGLVLDHLCRVRHCVNPQHLEAVSNAENVRRGVEAHG